MSDAAELEREAEAARARLSDTAEQIRARMSPGQLMDEVLNQFRGGDGSEMLANLRGQVRDNPMALALVGSGLAWLMLGSGAPAQARTTTGSYPAAGDAGFDPYRGGASYGGTGSGYPASRPEASAESGPDRGTVAAMGEGASDALASARAAVGEGLHAAGDRAHRMAHDLGAAGSDALGGLRHSASDVRHQARDTFLDVLEREPLVIGALGLAVGAAIGAFLPATEVEREHLGPAGQALKQKADALVDRGMAKAREAGAEIYETARDEADRQGLLPGDRPVAEKLDAVVRSVGETAGEIAERAAPGSGPKPGPGSAGAGPGTISDVGAGLDSDMVSDSGTGTSRAGTDPKPGRP
jgi:hypothetical protein